MRIYKSTEALASRGFSQDTSSRGFIRVTFLFMTPPSLLPTLQEMLRITVRIVTYLLRRYFLNPYPERERKRQTDVFVSLIMIIKIQKKITRSN